MLIPLDEVDEIEKEEEEDDGLNRLNLESLMKLVDDMNSGITRDQKRKYGPLDHRQTWIAILRSDGLQELTLAELKEKAGPLRLKKRQIEKFGAYDDPNTYIDILRSDDALGDIERAGTGTVSRPATAATTATEQSSSRPGTVDSSVDSETVAQYPSLMDGDEGAGTPEPIEYELIGFRIHHDNATYQTLRAESERADIKMVTEYDQWEDAQAEVARLRAILAGVTRTPKDDENEHHNTMLENKLDKEIKKEVTFVLESIVDCMERVDYNTKVRNYENNIKDDIYWN